jgi:2-keto-4-pentenoate hydratase/2-oxohepta-3-ene-1,7-dioic acid hydratase in catechol pathway
MARWARYQHAGGVHFGTLDEDGTLLEHSGDLFADPTPTGRRVALADVELLTPVDPSKMVALWNNFHGLITKTKSEVPPEPLYFFKSNSSFHPTGKPIRRPKAYAGRIIFEGEMGLVIGRECRDVEPEQAMEHLFGVTCVNDVTSIEILGKQAGVQQWTRCKAADTFGVMGPVVATGLDPSSLSVRAELNGQERQNYPITDMVFPVAELISSISKDMTLFPGDVISCGTNVGAGALRDGDVIAISIDGVGTLSNTFED